MTIQPQISKPAPDTSFAARIAPLGDAFAANAVLHDASDRFAADNFALVKQAGILPALIPAELGGLGAGYRDVADMLRSLAGSCSGTTLALSMHMHPVAMLVRRWRGDPAAVEAVLKRIATENLMLLSTGGNDWLGGSGIAVKVEGGYRFSGRKRFVSGCEAGNLLMTMAVCGDEVLHAGVPMKAEGISIEQTWRTLGMRASGSHDVVLKDVFVADAAISARRPAGVWHPFFHLVCVVAWPLIYSVYRGVAEKLRDETVRLASKRREDADTQILIGAMETALASVVATHERMLQIGDVGAPGEQTTATMMTLKRAMTESLLQVGSLALDAAGGSAFYRDNGIERLFRDLQAARYHPLTMLPQQKLAGRIAMGLNADGKAA
jgi:alkylation response protein AidB-like acyl-CoA dehydrogenase